MTDAIELAGEDARLLWMFKEVHGEYPAHYEIRVVEDDVNGDDDAVCIEVWKDGGLSMVTTKIGLMFDYLTRHVKS